MNLNLKTAALSIALLALAALETRADITKRGHFPAFGRNYNYSVEGKIEGTIPDGATQVETSNVFSSLLTLAENIETLQSGTIYCDGPTVEGEASYFVLTVEIEAI